MSTSARYLPLAATALLALGTGPACQSLWKPWSAHRETDASQTAPDLAEVIPGEDGAVTFTLLPPSADNNSLYGVWGSDANNVWAVGAGGTILKWNRDISMWVRQSHAYPDDLHAVWGTAPNSVWAVGASGTIAWAK